MVGVLFLALIVRLVNLGTFSLWLDEVLTMHFAALGFRDLVQACVRDAENVPLYAIAAWIAQRLGLAEPWIRLPSILAGVVGIGLFMRWMALRFGTRTAIVAGLITALSPFHVRYSQELRAYPWLLLVVPAAMLAAERLARDPSRWSVALMAATVAIGAYTHLTFWVVLPVFMAIVCSPIDASGSVRNRLTALLSAIAMGASAFLPWAVAIGQGLARRAERGGTDWSLTELEHRVAAITSAPWEGHPVTVGGLALVVLVAVGLGFALRRSDRWIPMSMLGAWVAWEVVLAAVGHWSDARYGLVAWFLVPMCIALAIAALRPRWLQVGITALCLIPLFNGLFGYWNEGRPHWDRIAAAVSEVRQPGDFVRAADEWTQICLGWYLDEPVPRLDGTAKDSMSVLVVRRGPNPPLEGPREAFPIAAELFRIRRTAIVERWSAVDTASWWAPQLIPPRISAPRERWRSLWANHADAPPNRFVEEFDPATASRIITVGLDRPRQTRDGRTAVWVVGHEAVLIVPRASAGSVDVEVELQPHPALVDRQWVRVLFGHRVVHEGQLARGHQTLSIPDVATGDDTGPAPLVLQFRHTVRPSEVNAGSRDTRRLAARIDRVSVTLR
jgi:hypothetical protein